MPRRSGFDGVKVRSPLLSNVDVVAVLIAINVKCIPNAGDSSGRQVQTSEITWFRALCTCLPRASVDILKSPRWLAGIDGLGEPESR